MGVWIMSGWPNVILDVANEVIMPKQVIKVQNVEIGICFFAFLPYCHVVNAATYYVVHSMHFVFLTLAIYSTPLVEAAFLI